MPARALRGIPWALLTYASTRAVTVLTTLVLARLLAPADFGLFAMGTLGMELVSVFSGLWLGAALIVRPDMDRRAEGTVLTLLVGSGALLALALSASAPLLAAFFGEPRLTGIVILLAAVLLVSGVNWFYETLLQRELAFRRRLGCRARPRRGRSGGLEPRRGVPGRIRGECRSAPVAHALPRAAGLRPRRGPPGRRERPRLPLPGPRRLPG